MGLCPMSPQARKGLMCNLAVAKKYLYLSQYIYYFPWVLLRRINKIRIEK